MGNANIIGNMRDWHESGVRVYNGMPALEVKVHDPIDAEQAVKDRLAYKREDLLNSEETRNLIGEAIDNALERLTESFWEDVQGLCAVVLNGYNIETGLSHPLMIVDDDGNVDEYKAHVTQQGRMGGWLVVTDWPDVDDWNDKAHERWNEFITWVRFYYRRATDEQNIGALAAEWIRDVEANQQASMENTFVTFTDGGAGVIHPITFGPYARVTVTAISVWAEDSFGSSATLVASRLRMRGLDGFMLQPTMPGYDPHTIYSDVELTTHPIEARQRGRFDA